MTAVEEIQAAIDKLVELKAKSTPGEWSAPERLLGLKNKTVFAGNPVKEQAAYVASAHDGQLIVTLHRTIDAQLGILSSALSDIAAWTDPNSDVGWQPEDGPTPNGPSFAAKLALARAINGVTP